jgi:hypothetical protein
LFQIHSPWTFLHVTTSDIFALQRKIFFFSSFLIDVSLLWAALPYIKAPLSDPRLRVYFSKEWLDTFVVSFGNFLNEVLGGIHILLTGCTFFFFFFFPSFSFVLELEP